MEGVEVGGDDMEIGEVSEVEQHDVEVEGRGGLGVGGGCCHCNPQGSSLSMLIQVKQPSLITTVDSTR